MYLQCNKRNLIAFLDQIIKTGMKCFNWSKFPKNMIEFPFPLMKYELVRELSFIDCVLPIPCFSNILFVYRLCFPR